MNAPVLVAIDLGAESCRVSLLRWIDGAPVTQLVHRFANGPKSEGATLRWDVEAIVSGIEQGLRMCAELAPGPIAAIGVDGWAVDYVRLGPDGKLVARPFCYRDERTVEAERAVHSLISPDQLYELTGIQLLRLNTLYQLYADGKFGITQGAPWVNLPEYITCRLGGSRVAEYTNATHTGLVSMGKHEWCGDIFAAAELDMAAAPPIVCTGATVGRLRGPLAELPAFRDTRLIVPATHDTASAVAGIPAEGDNWAFISSGTWSLVGTLLDKPCVNSQARQKNFTNLGGAGGRICFLKNVNGMWLLRQCMDHWEAQGYSWTIDALLRACAELPGPDFLLDVDDPDLLLPGNMPGKINAQRLKAGKAAMPDNNESAPALANTIFHSLAARYAEVLQDIKAITGKSIDRLYVVGGGSRNVLLNRLTAERSRLELRTGAAESATIGNFAIQMAALDGDFDPCIGVSHAAVAKWAGVLAGSQEVREKTR